uniref:Fructose-bisphosphate aldolase n=1 Tax=Zooxanthella nutricula TaxID=1333877 RepID=A0A6U9E866_9DINO
MGACHAPCAALKAEAKAIALEEEASHFLDEAPLSANGTRKSEVKKVLVEEAEGETQPPTSDKLSQSRWTQLDGPEVFRRVGFAEGFVLSLEDEGSCAPEHAAVQHLSALHDRVLRSQAVAQGAAIAATVPEDAAGLVVDGQPLPKFLWQKARAAPFLSFGGDLAPEADGARGIGAVDGIDERLQAAFGEGYFGVKASCLVRMPNATGIQRVVQEQLDFARRALEKDLVPILRIEVDSACPDKAHCEQMVVDKLIVALDEFSESRQDCGSDVVILQLALPTRPNAYIPLVEHPRTLRVTASSGSYGCMEACKKLTKNIGMIAAFGRALLEGLHAEQNDEAFEEVLAKTCASMHQASRSLSPREEQRIKVESQDGFFVGFDIVDKARALRIYGVEADSEQQIRSEWVALHTRVFTNRSFHGSRVVGALIGEAALLQTIDGMPLAAYLWEHKRVVPFLRLTEGYQEEIDGVRKMADVPNLTEVLESAIAKGICGAKVQSSIVQPNVIGIKRMVTRLFGFCKAISEHGLIPLLQIEINAAGSDKGACERLLFEALIEELGTLKVSEQVVLRVPIPELPNMFMPVMRHPNVLRVSALSASALRSEACAQLAQNVGLVAAFGRAFLEGMQTSQTDEAFTQALDRSCRELYHASFAVPTREEQVIKVETTPGFFVALDETGTAAIAKILQRYGIDPADFENAKSANTKFRQMHIRIMSNLKFNGTRIVGVTLHHSALGMQIEKMPVARYLWDQKNIVLFVRLGGNLAPLRDGVQLMQSIPDLEDVLERAKSAGAFGTKARSVIKGPDVQGIRTLVEQQFSLGTQVMRTGLTPILHIEVDINAEDKMECERLLLHMLLERLSKLAANEKVVFQLTLPSKVNLYLPLMAFPNTIRVVASSSGYTRSESCKLLAQNVGMVAGFSRALLEGLSVGQSASQFTKTLIASIRLIFNVSRDATEYEEQLAKVGSQDGFFAALDQGATNVQKTLQKYGVQCDDAGVMDKIHEMRSRFMTNGRFNGARVIATIFGEDTLSRDVEYLSTARFLWERRKITPILRLDSGLQKESGGVRMSKDILDLDALLDRALANSVYFVKTNAIILQSNAVGIKRVVDQQFDIAKKVLAKGLVPVLQTEVDIHVPDKASCEQRLRQVVMGALNRNLEDTQKVVLVFSLPTKPDMYASLIQHPKVLRLACSSGGYDRAESCTKLAEIPDVIASIGRAFTEGMTVNQTDKEFTDTVDGSCRMIYEASISPQLGTASAKDGKDLAQGKKAISPSVSASTTAPGSSRDSEMDKS